MLPQSNQNLHTWNYSSILESQSTHSNKKIQKNASTAESKSTNINLCSINFGSITGILVLKHLVL